MSEDTKLIHLTQGKICIVDSCDYDTLIKHKWFASSVDKRVWYAQRTHNENGRKGKRHCVFIHRAILGLVGIKGISIDHIDGDGLNNTRSNLRIVTQSQNLQNSRKHHNNKTGYKGVHIEIRGASTYYRARIKVEGKTLSLGYFKDKLSAAKSYNEAALKFFGEYAKPNDL